MALKNFRPITPSLRQLVLRAKTGAHAGRDVTVSEFEYEGESPVLVKGKGKA